MKVGVVICVADFHDLCPRLFPRGSFGESRKVGVMEFGLYITVVLCWRNGTVEHRTHTIGRS